MSKPFDTKYKDTKFMQPAEIDPKIKSGEFNSDADMNIAKKFYLEKCQFLYSSYLRDDAYIPYTSSLTYRTNRLYAQGNQPVTKYMELSTIKDKKTGGRKGWSNISWDIMPLMPKFRAIVLGKFDDIDYNISNRAIDENSSTVREDMKLNVKVQSKYAEILEPIKKAIGKQEGIDTGDSHLPYVPRSADEFEMMAQLGAFKLSWELSMDYLNNETLKKNNWPELKRRLIEDAIDIGVIGIKDYQDPQTNLPMCRYVDPENLLIRQTRRNDYFDVSEVGELVWYTIEQLRSVGIPEKDLKNIGGTYSNQWGNPTYLSDNYSSSGLNNGMNKLDGIRACVLDVEFQSFDRWFYESRIIDGKEVPFDLPWGVTKTTRKENKLIVKNKPKFYRAKWVVGTNVVFDYGPQYDVPYKQNARPKSSFSCYRISDRSMVNQCISSLDDFQLTILKIRNALAKSRPKGLKFEWGALSEISVGDEKLSPFDLLKIFDDTGNIIYTAKINPQTGVQVQGAASPIEETMGGIGPYLAELEQTTNFIISNIRGTTGLNEITDASAPAPNALVGTAKIAEAATNHALRPILYSYKSVKQAVCANLTNRWQIVAKFFPQNITTSVGNTAFDVISVGSKLFDPVFDTYCDALISDEDKGKIEMALQQSMNAAKTGSIGITTMDYFYINQMIAIGNIRWAWVYLSYREEKMRTDAQAAASKTQAEQGQMVMEQKKADQEFQLTLIEKQGQQERLTELTKHKFKMQEIAATNAKQNSQPQSAAAK